MSASQTPDMEGVFSVGDCIADKYVIEQVIGAGGMGVVVVAHHQVLGKPVAIKFLLPEVAEHAEPRERFLREAKAAIELRSEHVAHVTDVGALESGAPYMVMEYLEGRDLDEILTAEGALSVSETLELVLQACEALAEAHARGLVHRDIKPANLFVTHRADGSPLVKLLDFGISRAAIGTEDEQRLTATHAVLGTPTYMAPEQLRGARNADARSDVWAIGATVHELLCAAPPFTGETMTALCVAIVEDQPTPLSQLVNHVPAELEAAVLKCLEKDPAQRFQSIGAFVRAVEPLAPASARPAIDLIISIDDNGLSEERLSPKARRDRSTSRSHDAAAYKSTRPGYDPGDESPELARTGVADGDAEAGDTVGSWQSDTPRKRGIAGMMVAVLAVIGVGITWSALRTDGPTEPLSDHSSASPSTMSASPSATAIGRETTDPSQAPSASLTTTVSSAAPSVSVTPRPKTSRGSRPPTRPHPPTTAGTPPHPVPSSETPVDPLGDRK